MYLKQDVTNKKGRNAEKRENVICSICAQIQALNGMKNTEKGLELKCTASSCSPVIFLCLYLCTYWANGLTFLHSLHLFCGLQDILWHRKCPQTFIKRSAFVSLSWNVSPSEETSGVMSCLPLSGIYLRCFKTLSTEPYKPTGEISLESLSIKMVVLVRWQREWEICVCYLSTTFVNRGFGPLLHADQICALVVSC